MLNAQKMRCSSFQLWLMTIESSGSLCWCCTTLVVNTEIIKPRMRWVAVIHWKFVLTYKEKSSENVIIKMHWMFSHFQSWLDTYHSVGLFSEDSMESINALVNRLSRTYASLDGNWWAHSFLKFIAAVREWAMSCQREMKMKEGDNCQVATHCINMRVQQGVSKSLKGGLNLMIKWRG